jgi:hypothetical protein
MDGTPESGTRSPTAVELDQLSVGISIQHQALAHASAWLLSEIAVVDKPIDSSCGQQAFSINEFCKRWDISPSHYHKLKRLGRGPREAHLGSVIRITRQAELDFQREREISAKAETTSQAQR